MFAAAWILIFPLVLLHQGSALLLDPHCEKDTAKASHNPWMALITTETQQCTGTLINNQHVLTAASCVVNQSQALVRLGDFTNPQLESRMFEDFYVQRAMVHYLFNPIYYLNNIALLRLQRAVDYKPHIRPICLSLGGTARDRTELLKNYSAFVFGNKNEGPRRVHIQRLNPNHCEDTSRFTPLNTMICGISRDRSSCAETGSPLVKKITIDGITHTRLVAINSYGRSEKCVYTNVISYVGWIVQNILDVKIVV